MRELLRFFCLQYVVCAMVTWNTRALARADVPNTIVSDIAFSLVNFTIIKKIADAEHSYWAMAGYLLGNVLGSLTTIYITRYFWGS